MERPILHALERWSGQELPFVQPAVFREVLKCKQFTVTANPTPAS